MHSPFLARLQTSPLHFILSSAMGIVLLASSSASIFHGNQVAWNQNPISFLSTCSPSFSLAWSTYVPFHLPVLIVNATSICTWHCSSPGPYSSHGIFFSIVATVACPSSHHEGAHGEQAVRGCEEHVASSADASPPPPLPLAPFPCSALSAPLTFILSFPGMINSLFPIRNGIRTSSTVELCVTGRSPWTPNITTYLPPCVMSALPPPPFMISPALHSLLPSFPPLRVCTPHTSNQVRRIVSQATHRAVSAAAPFTQEELEQVEKVSQFDLAFEVDEGAVAGCARLLLLPAIYTSTSPIFDIDSQKHASPSYVQNFPFRLNMKVSIRLDSPLFSTEGSMFARPSFYRWSWLLRSLVQLLFVAFCTICLF
jgi:hypothetical protein